MRFGISGYGSAIPRMRIKIGEIARVWGKNGESISEGLGVKEKAVAAFDEDSCTLAVESARNAMESSQISAEDIGAVFVGSESKPYAVKPTASIVATAIGASTNLMAADLEFACKAGTAGIQACMGMVASGMIKAGIAVGSDTAQGRPNDALEYTAGSGAGAVVVGKENCIAEIEDTFSFTTDTADFWRRQHAHFPRHAGRFTAEPAYFRHVLGAAKGLMEKMGSKADDYDYAVFHQPNGKFPYRAAKLLGFPEEKIKQGLLTPTIGNTYSGASMIGLASVLDIAKAGEKIFLVSYGSGAGSDAFSLKVTKEIEKKGRRQRVPVSKQVENRIYVDYAIYARHRRKLKSL